MRTGQAEQVEQETRDQAGLLPGLDAGRQALGALLREAGFEDGPQGVRQLLDSAAAAARASLSRRWSELRAGLRTIRDNNQRNAMLANSHHKAILNSLMQITGHERAQGNAYGRDGRREDGPRSRVIARA